MFADDTNLFCTDSDVDNLFLTMNSELSNISEWFKANRLSLNVSKTKYTLFHPPSKASTLPLVLPKITIQGKDIARDQVTKFLGVYLDENISWKSHIANITQKVTQIIGILYKSKQFLNIYNLKQIYFSFIHSYLNYANIAWASTNKTKLSKLFRLQRHAVKVIYNQELYTDAIPLLSDMRALSVYQINVFQHLCLMFKCKNETAPQSFHYLYTVKPQVKYGLRNSNQLVTPLVKRRYGQFKISYRAPHLWNNIVANKDHLHNIQSLPLFGINIKQILMNNLENIYQYF